MNLRPTFSKPIAWIACNIALITLTALPNLSAQTNSDDSEIFWLGARVRDLSDMEYITYGTTTEARGIDLIEVPSNSAAAKAGFQEKDLIQAINGESVKTVSDLLYAYAQVGLAPLDVSAIRYKQGGYLPIDDAPRIIVQSVPAPEVTSVTSAKVSANQSTKNDPLPVLIDGKIEKSYGPVFANDSKGGAYKLELAQSTPISTITSWSHHISEARGVQIVTIYGSNSTKDPGWNLEDRTKFTPLASINTTQFDHELFTSATLQAPAGKTIGTYKWIVWKTSSINQIGENTAFQEFIVR